MRSINLFVVLCFGASLAGSPGGRSESLPAAPSPASPPAAQRLFASGFENGVRLVPPLACWDTGCWQDIAGVDAATRFSWPPRLQGGTAKFLLLTYPVPITPQSIDQYTFNRIETVTGPQGGPTRALYQETTQGANGRLPKAGSTAQNELQFLPKTDVTEMYVSYQLKLQPDLVARMRNLPPGPGIRDGATWRGIFAFKTGGQRPDGEPADNGDYRLEVYVMTDRSGPAYWAVVGDNNAGGGAPVVTYWSRDNHTVPVPADQWFRVEVYWRRSDDADGRMRVAINGQTIAEHRGPNLGAHRLPINRIIAPLLYTGGTMPVYQWVDDLEIWNGQPPR